MNIYSTTPTITRDNITYYSSVVYPVIPYDNTDIYTIMSEGDRLDLIAFDYWNDATAWKLLLIVNPDLPQGSIYPPVGSQIRIPININTILDVLNS